MEKRKTILLTGATGFLGSELLKRFITLDYDINILIRKAHGINAAERLRMILARLGIDEYPQYLQNGRIHALEGDITSANLGLKHDIFHHLMDRVDEVFHCAAATKFSGISRDDMFRTNYTGTENILEFCISGKRKHLHHISTAYVCGEKRGIVYENEISGSHGFRNHYEESKFMAEKVIYKYSLTHGVVYTIYRPGIIVGDSRTGYTMNFDGIYFFAKMIVMLKNRFESMVKRGLKGIYPAQERKLTGLSVCLPERERLSACGHAQAGSQSGNVQANRTEDKSGDKSDLPLIKSDQCRILPIRIPAAPGATVNLVPIDYVANSIMAIFLDSRRANKTFHIVNPSPPILSFLIQAINEAVGISGIAIIDCKGPQRDFIASPNKSIWEKIKIYSPYMMGEPYFQSNNAQDILNDFYIRCPKITKEMVSLLLNFAIASNWGKG